MQFGRSWIIMHLPFKQLNIKNFDKINKVVKSYSSHCKELIKHTIYIFKWCGSHELLGPKQGVEEFTTNSTPPYNSGPNTSRRILLLGLNT